MKTAIFIISAIFILAACTKQSATTNCYSCTSNDSVSCNIAALVNPHYKGTTGLNCRLSDAQKDFYVMQNTKADTLFNENDTVEIEHWTMQCTIAY